MYDDLGRIFDEFASMEKIFIIACCIFVPLGIWKLVDIIIWFCQHINLIWVS